MTIVLDTFKEIRNYLMLVEKDVFRWCNDENDQFKTILELLGSGNINKQPDAIITKHAIKETYKISYITEENTEREEEYLGSEDIECFWIVSIADKFYKIPGIFSSWDNSAIHWEEAYEVEPYEKTVIDYRRIGSESKD